jgi:hypothetical protein
MLSIRTEITLARGARKVLANPAQAISLIVSFCNRF